MRRSALALDQLLHACCSISCKLPFRKHRQSKPYNLHVGPVVMSGPPRDLSDLVREIPTSGHLHGFEEWFRGMPGPPRGLDEILRGQPGFHASPLYSDGRSQDRPRYSPGRFVGGSIGGHTGVGSISYYADSRGGNRRTDGTAPRYCSRNHYPGVPRSPFPQARRPGAGGPYGRTDTRSFSYGFNRPMSGGRGPEPHPSSRMSYRSEVIPLLPQMKQADFLIVGCAAVWPRLSLPAPKPAQW